MNELHDVVVHAVVLAHAVHRHDIRVVHAGGGLGLALEALLLARIEHRLGRQDLERDMPAERFLLGLVDDAHAATADFAQNAKIAQALQRLAAAGERGPRADAAREIADVAF